MIIDKNIPEVILQEKYCAKFGEPIPLRADYYGCCGGVGFNEKLIQECLQYGIKLRDDDEDIANAILYYCA